MYRDQPLFGDVCAFLNEGGFHFVGFIRLGHGLSPYRGPSGLRGKGFLDYGDALFLRRLDSLANSAWGAEKIESKTQKLAFLALFFGQVEYALECLKHGPASRAPQHAHPVYLRSLREFAAATDQTPT